MVYWRSAADKVKTWTFLNKESEPMRPPLSQTGCLITIGTVHHVWRKVSEEHKFKYLETRKLNQNALENTFVCTVVQTITHLKMDKTPTFALFTQHYMNSAC